MTKGSFRVVYDSATDTLYVPSGGPSRSLGREPGPEGPLDASDGGLVGVSVAEFDAVWRDRFDALGSKLRPGPSSQAAAVLAR